MARKKHMPTVQQGTLGLHIPMLQPSFKQEAYENPVVQEVIRVFDARIVAISQLLPKDVARSSSLDLSRSGFVGTGYSAGTPQGKSTLDF